MGKRLTPLYKCIHFLADAWEEETGYDMRGIMACFMVPPRQRSADPALAKAFVRIPAPSSPCVVLMRRGAATPHVGLFVRGRVFHLTARGARREPLHIATFTYPKDLVRFYALR